MGAKAPRLQAYYERKNGVSSFIMPRADWELLSVNSTEHCEIDVKRCPISGVEQNANEIAVIANKVGNTKARVLVYRNDPKDAPKDWNVDHYSVETNLSSRKDLQIIINKASTSFDNNTESFIKENVFWIKEDLSDDHWISSKELPKIVQVIIEKKKS
jgi:hypothetical protein